MKQAQHYKFNAMGSPCELRLYGNNSSAVADAAIEQVASYEQRYSRYIPSSIVSQINDAAGGQPVPVDSETQGLLHYADALWQQSDGLFDITSGIFRRIWDFKTGKIPSQADIDALLPLVGWQQIEHDGDNVRLPKVGMQLDFGGLVKEYCADATAKLCRELGIQHGLVDLGGDIAIIGPHPDGKPWSVGIRNPQAPLSAMATIHLTNGALASSGDYERFVELNGKRYSHLINPKTGWPVQSFRSVSAAAPSCLLAGTASTTAMLKGEADGISWLKTLGLRWCAMRANGEAIGELAG